MEKTSKRLFVGNLTSYTSENDLQKAFGRYGNIDSVELKQKPNLVDPQNPTHFAFITIVTDDFSMNKCLNRFSEKDLNGQFLNVSLARESFLDKLKKEREETENKKINVHENGFAKTTPKIKHTKQSNDSISKYSAAKKKTFDSDDEIFNDDDTNYNNSIVKEDSPKKPLDDNEKRIESLKKMNENYENKKLLIQKALSGEIVTNKIKFDFYESDDEPVPKKKIDLFQNSDNDDSEDENVNLKAVIKYREQFETKAGQKLLKTQSKFNADPRFKMDTKFLEEENDEEDNSIKIKNFEHKITEDDDLSNDNIDDNIKEKETQIRIMEEIVGKKLTRLVDPNKKNHLKTMIRYDPKNEEHQEMINSMETTSKTKKKKSSVIQTEESSPKIKKKTEEPKKVSQDQFYVIDDTLKDALKLRGDGFSLLAMFGRKDNGENVVEDSKKEIEKHDNEKILAKSANLQMLVAQTQENPFNFDSSDSEDEENSNVNTNEAIIKKITNKQESKKEKSKSGGKKTKSGVWMENLFIVAGDKRLKEGTEFFSSRKQKETENGEEKVDYGQTMEKLRKIINKKISKSKKSMEAKHIFKKNRKLKNKKIKK